MSVPRGVDRSSGWAPLPEPRGGVHVLEVLGIAFGMLGLLALLTWMAAAAGLTTTVAHGVLALVPLAVVALTIRWIDGWEPEPRATVMAAFFWGAGVATAVSLVLNTAVFAWAEASDGMGTIARTAIPIAVGAPVIEETSKGIGVLLVFLLRRREFDGPVDGIVYGAVIAAGFAFTENIQYFAAADSVVATFFARGVMAPFAHVTFTAVTGVALGIAAARRRAWPGLFLLGLAGAIALHALWNFSTLSVRHLALYLLLQVPMFLVMVAIVVWLRARELAVLRFRLGEYSRAGWLTPAEVGMLTNRRERRRALTWAAGRGRRAEMLTLQRAATALATHRERIASGRVPADGGAAQAAALETITRARSALYA